MSNIPVIVAIATAWGPKHGGINAFNIELLRSLGAHPWRVSDPICIVLRANPEDHNDARRHNVKLVAVECYGSDFPHDSATKIKSLLQDDLYSKQVIWLGHDDKSGPLALELWSQFPNSYAVLVNHMAHGAYQDYKKGDSVAAAEKREFQRKMFGNADLCFAIGPMLSEQLEDLLRTTPNKPPIEMLVPGLVDPIEYGVKASDSAPHNFTAFVAGRLGEEDDRIKQGSLAVCAFGKAVHAAFREVYHVNNALRRSPTLRMRGVPEKRTKAVRQLLRTASMRELNCDILDYTDDRCAYFTDLAASSVAMMPSWHEGFGLTAWEAIACQVPVIIGEQSGVFRLLNEKCQGAGLHKSVRSVPVAGHSPESTEESNHTEKDVSAVANELLSLGFNITQSKADAVELRALLRRLGYGWAECAKSVLDKIEHNLGIMLYVEPQVIRQPKITPIESPQKSVISGIPDYFLPPERREWKPETGLAPSAMLVARDEVVRFHAERNQIVTKLFEWIIQGTAPFGIRLITGPGGMGKTRLAIELQRRLSSTEFCRLWFGSELPDDWLNKWRRWLDSAHGRKIMLVVDYAETRQKDLLLLLSSVANALRTHQEPFILRVLLLARTGDWWRELKQHSFCTDDVAAILSGRTNEGVLDLPPWQDNVAIRETTFRNALHDYALAMGQPVPEHPYLPDFAKMMFNRPLYLHMAALAALEGERPEHAATLIEGQLLREWRHWVRRHGDKLCCYDDWADAIAWIALSQGASADRAEETLAILAPQALGLHRALTASYPANNGIAPLQPDLLAEVLLRERLSGSRAQLILSLALVCNEKQSFRHLLLLTV